MKKVLSILCLVFICTNFCFLPVFAEEDPRNDMIERDGFHWLFDPETATYTISGNGEMYDFSTAPLTGDRSPVFMRDDVKHIIVKDGITTIGNGAFRACFSLESIKLPNTVTSIGTLAFEGCDSLKEIEIPASVKTTGIYVFGLETEDPAVSIEKITFYGNPPKSEYNSLFAGFDGTVYYPADNEAWTEEVIAAYEYGTNSNITWVAFDAPELTKAEQKFVDVSADGWYLPSVQYVYENGIMSGVGSAKFDPAGKLTREQLMQVFFAMENKNKADYEGETGYSDVAEGKWYSPAVKWAKAEGITNGVKEDTFGIGQHVTREQLATFIMNYTEYKQGKAIADADLADFSDADSISDWAVEGIQYCVGRGIIKGRANGTLDPKATANRAELAQILKQYGTLTPFDLIFGNASTLIVDGTCDYVITNAEDEKLIYSKGEVFGDMNVYNISILTGFEDDMKYVVAASEEFTITCDNGCCTLNVIG